MSRFEDFSIGQRVAHINCGDGLVVDILRSTTTGNDEIWVTYDRKTEKGQHWQGRYDRDWFRLHPNYLFHRTNYSKEHPK